MIWLRYKDILHCHAQTPCIRVVELCPVACSLTSLWHQQPNDINSLRKRYLNGDLNKSVHGNLHPPGEYTTSVDLDCARAVEGHCPQLQIGSAFDYRIDLKGGFSLHPMRLYA